MRIHMNEPLHVVFTPSHSHTLTHLRWHGCYTSPSLETFLAQGDTRKPGVIAFPCDSHFPPPEQLMTQWSPKLWSQNGCLSGMEVSHHPDNQVKPFEYHQCAQQSQGSECSSPHDPSLELICCRRNRILVLHDSDNRQTLETFSILNDWLSASQNQTQQYTFKATKELQQN